MVNKKLVSIIIPVYNGERYLGAAIESVMNQNHRPDEVIVVDDGSMDNTDLVARQYSESVIYVRQENRGPAAARNMGLSMAQGDIVGFLDADDLWSKDKIRLQIGLLRNSPSAEIVLGYTQIMMLTGIINGIHVFKEWGAPVLAMSVGGAMFRKSVFDKIGLFDETQRYCDDWDWFMRARELNIEMVVQKEVVQLYRRHDQNITNQQSLGNQYFVRMLKKSLDRRRREKCGQVESLPKLSCVGEESAGSFSASAEEQAKD